jgi:phosphatidylserine decarboxylase
MASVVEDWRMRIPLARAGAREMILISLGCGALTALGAWGVALGCAWCWPPVVIAPVLWAAGLAFFRDPQRVVPGEPDTLVAPADGVIVETVNLDHDPEINAPARRISIFLSVLNVHINRSPCGGVVRMIRYQPGAFIDARDPESGRRNESNMIVIDPDCAADGPIIVRQIAGLIARRIVCDVKVGQRLERGQRIGMIKFGSRTELIYPAASGYHTTVAVGQPSRGAATVVASKRGG